LQYLACSKTLFRFGKLKSIHRRYVDFRRRRARFRCFYRLSVFSASVVPSSVSSIASHAVFDNTNVVTAITDIIVLVIALFIAHVLAVPTDFFADVVTTSCALIAQPPVFDLTSGGASVGIDDVSIIAFFDSYFSAVSAVASASV
jgi:hypothetical protein